MVYINPRNGNREVWKEQPKGYFTEEEWVVAQPKMSLDEYKAVTLDIMKNRFESLEAFPYIVGAGFPMSCRIEDVSKLQFGISYAETQQVKTMDVVDSNNVQHVGMSLEDVKALSQELIGRAMYLFDKKQSIRKRIMAAADTDEVDAIVDSETFY